LIQLGIQLDQAQITQAEMTLRHIPGAIKRAVVRAGNETFAEARTFIVKSVREKINIKASDIKSHIKKPLAMRWVGGKVEGKLVVPWGERLGLKYFGAKQTKQGVTYAIRKGAGRSRIPSAFIGTQRLGGQVFIRRGPRKRPRVKKLIHSPSTNKRYAWPDLPIKKLQGASIWGVLLKNNLLEPVRQKMQRDFHKNLLQRVDAELLRSQGRLRGQAS
jgi:hypothetical protein